jgi:16S rRNA (uracil1498-N3)-methyltransferase
MKLPRLYVHQSLVVGADLLLPKETAHYVQQVLRLREGAAVVLFNGLGGEYRGVLRLNKKEVMVNIQDFIDHSVASELNIHLGQGISRGEKMDFVVQKAVELGVREITPLLTERCGVKLEDDRIAKRLTHWQKIIFSACEQSGRNDIPLINPPTELKQWIMHREETRRFICHPGLTSESKDSNSPTSVVLLIGPEGGLTEEEVQSALHQQFESLSLGPRILRTETAAIAALTKLQVNWGDI